MKFKIEGVMFDSNENYNFRFSASPEIFRYLPVGLFDEYAMKAAEDKIPPEYASKPEISFFLTDNSLVTASMSVSGHSVCSRTFGLPLDEMNRLNDAAGEYAKTHEWEMKYARLHFDVPISKAGSAGRDLVFTIRDPGGMHPFHDEFSHPAAEKLQDIGIEPSMQAWLHPNGSISTLLVADMGDHALLLGEKECESGFMNELKEAIGLYRELWKHREPETIKEFTDMAEAGNFGKTVCAVSKTLGPDDSPSGNAILMFYSKELPEYLEKAVPLMREAGVSEMRLSLPSGTFQAVPVDIDYHGELKASLKDAGTKTISLDLGKEIAETAQPCQGKLMINDRGEISVQTLTDSGLAMCEACLCDMITPKEEMSDKDAQKGPRQKM